MEQLKNVKNTKKETAMDMVEIYKTCKRSLWTMFYNKIELLDDGIDYFPGNYNL